MEYFIEDFKFILIIYFMIPVYIGFIVYRIIISSVETRNIVIRTYLNYEIGIDYLDKNNRCLLYDVIEDIMLREGIVYGDLHMKIADSCKHVPFFYRHAFSSVRIYDKILFYGISEYIINKKKDK